MANLNRIMINGTSLLDQIYPVGALYTSSKSTDPGTIFGGTWTRVKGKVIVGVDENDTDFKTVKATGGEKTHTLTTAEMPSHQHKSATRWCGDESKGYGLGTDAAFLNRVIVSSAAAQARSTDPTGGGVLTTICLHMWYIICGSVLLKSYFRSPIRKGGLV